MGQFEGRTLIIVDEGATVHYVEGCCTHLLRGLAAQRRHRDHRAQGRTLPLLRPSELVTNVYNLVTQRSLVYDGGTMEWVDANLGSKVTMKYPSVYMRQMKREDRFSRWLSPVQGNTWAQAASWSIPPPDTTSQLISKSISKGGGRASYRGLPR